MIKFVILIVSSIFLTQMAFADGILLSSEVSLAKVETLTTDDLKSDLDVLLSTLDKAYGGKSILPGTQYTDLVDGLKNLKLKISNISSKDFCNQIADLTEKVNDDHLTVHIEDQTCRRQWPAATVGPNSGVGKANSTWSVSFKNYQNQLVPVLAIQKMSPSGSPEWNGFLETVQGLVKTNKAFIIDMRRNPGGDAAKGTEMARLLYGIDQTQQVPMPKKKIYRQRSVEAWSVLANTFWLEMQALTDKTQLVPDYSMATYQSLVGYRQKAIDGQIPTLDIEKLGSAPVDLSRAITFPVYVLVDRNCGSSCELTLEALENLPSVITVGENTTGVVQYGNVGALYLPSSHIVIRMPTQGAKYDDQRQVEKIGYSPKWKVPSGTDALDYTLNQFFH